MNMRGPSCYREVDAALKPAPRSVARNTAGLPILALGKRKPWVNQWPTPNPLEIVVTLRQAGDDPDRIAEFVERLRYGFGHYAEWTALPAPLFFERVVRDYISGFALEDDQDEADDDETD
jgi:hypothetical protein